MPAILAKTVHLKRKASVANVDESDRKTKRVRMALETRSKRKRDEAEPDSINNAKRLKLSSSLAKTPISKKAPVPEKGARGFRKAPTASLDIFVFGEGTGGELGLGSKTVNGKGKQPFEVLQPRLNTLLCPKDVGVVQLSCGGLHRYTWGVNDNGALGRVTDIANVEEDDELNPAESTPGVVDTSHLNPSIVWAQVVGSDSASFALTEDGKVYGWGTFRGNNGIMGFRENIRIQKTPYLIPELKSITQLAAGNNHVLALDDEGKIYA
ncbi:hypothetical protein AAE478_010477 [Parahypoxylon ruwenzoriense]